MRDTRMAFLALAGLVLGILISLPYGPGLPAHPEMGIALESMTLVAIVILTNTL